MSMHAFVFTATMLSDRFSTILLRSKYIIRNLNCSKILVRYKVYCKILFPMRLSGSLRPLENIILLLIKCLRDDFTSYNIRKFDTILEI